MSTPLRIGNRLQMARKMKALSLQQLAQEVGISKQMLSKYEQGLQLPGTARLLQLSKLLGQPIDFFTSQAEQSVPAFSFRKRSKLKGKALAALELQVRLRMADYLFVEDVCAAVIPFENPLSELVLTQVDDVYAAALTLRERWQIGYDALASVVNLLEDKGIKIIEVSDPSGLFDGLACWIDGKHPMLVIAREMPVERKRFTLVHELGHLLLNLSAFDEKNQEAWCNAFASEFLVPSEVLQREVGGKREHISSEELMQLQEKYGMSPKALLYKLGDLGLLAAYKVRDFYIRLNQNQPLKQMLEAERFAGTERPMRFEQLVYRALVLEEGGISMSKGAYLLGKKLEEVRETMTLHLI
ncbi:MAG: DNA-binding protein [Sphingobacteriaceae bacterium]|nr:DNA-binding protein [Sphingobacteriaceae bacterium]